MTNRSIVVSASIALAIGLALGGGILWLLTEPLVESLPPFNGEQVWVDRRADNPHVHTRITYNLFSERVVAVEEQQRFPNGTVLIRPADEGELVLWQGKFKEVRSAPQKWYNRRICGWS